MTYFGYKHTGKMFEEVFHKQEDESLEAHCGEQLTLKVCCCCLDYLRQARALQS